MGAESEKKENHEKETPIASPTTLTQDQFLSWKRHKGIANLSLSQNYLYLDCFLQDAAESARKAEASRKRAEDIAAGTVQMNGRELFLHEPWVFDDSHF